METIAEEIGRKLTEKMVSKLRRQARAALSDHALESSSAGPALHIVARLEPDSMSMGRRAHVELRDWFLHCMDTCGMVDPELVPIFNGLKEWIEGGPWVFQDSEWQPWPNRAEVVK